MHQTNKINIKERRTYNHSSLLLRIDIYIHYLNFIIGETATNKLPPTEADRNEAKMKRWNRTKSLNKFTVDSFIFYICILYIFVGIDFDEPLDCMENQWIVIAPNTIDQIETMPHRDTETACHSIDETEHCVCSVAVTAFSKLNVCQ